jgi:hypothetical protein
MRTSMSTMMMPHSSTIEYVIRPVTPCGLAPCNLVHGELLLQIDEELDTFKEAEVEEVWQDVTGEEIKSIEENHTWRLIALPPEHRPIGLKWVYKVKKNTEGTS